MFKFICIKCINQRNNGMCVQCWYVTSAMKRVWWWHFLSTNNINTYISAWTNYSKNLITGCVHICKIQRLCLLCNSSLWHLAIFGGRSYARFIFFPRFINERIVDVLINVRHKYNSVLQEMNTILTQVPVLNYVDLRDA